MAKLNGSKKRSTKQSWCFDIVKRVKTDPESRTREKARESFSKRLQRRDTENNLRKMTEQKRSGQLLPI
jgi:hypothetical protein